MAKSTRVQPKGVWRMFHQDLSTFSRWFQDGLTGLASWVFAFNQAGAQRRMNLFIVATLLLWFILALMAHPIRVGREPVLLQLLNALFSPGVFRHFVVLLLALWVGFRVASIYLSDIFELKDVKTAENFIRGAVFPGQHSVISIREGKVALESQDSSLFKIGGPGYANVHLENVALFERVDGTPHVIEPSRTRMELLEGFERYRDAIDLRDQVLELDMVEGRTLDGILVQAKDVRMVFSIYRGDRPVVEGDSFEQPYPFDKNAVEALIYKQGTGGWYNAMRYLIIGDLREFIASHTLSEFLANAPTQGGEDDFVTRDRLTSLFYDFTSSFTNRAADRGVQLDWIGVGTWVTPSEIIPDRHLEAWKLSCENRGLRSSLSLRKEQNDARLGELLHLIDEVLAHFYLLRESQPELNPREIRRSLALLYREKLRHAQELYTNAELPPNPEVDEAIRHITYVT
jgi:hypothetical protein